MKRVVIDTNVLISSALSPEGPPSRIMGLISNKEIQLFYCLAIIDEYKRVLAYDKLNILPQIQERAINEIIRLGILTVPDVSDVPLLDEDDRVFYDTAKDNEAILITGNTKHYPDESFIMTPSDFLNFLEEND